MAAVNTYGLSKDQLNEYYTSGIAQGYGFNDWLAKKGITPTSTPVASTNTTTQYAPGAGAGTLGLVENPMYNSTPTTTNTPNAPIQTQYPTINGASWNPASGVPYDTWANNMRNAQGQTPTYSNPTSITPTGTTNSGSGFLSGTTPTGANAVGATIPTETDGKYKGYTETPFDQYSIYGLQSASNLLANNLNTYGNNPYPSYVSAAQNAPTKEQFFQYEGTQPLQMVNPQNYNFSAGDYSQSAGDYKGLMSGDYEKLQQALTTPGELAAQDAYGQGYNNLKSIMGGNGLYGSSIMQNQATQGLDKVLQNTVATNAANAVAQRYGLQAEDLAKLNQFNQTREQNLNQFNLSREQEFNKYNLSADDLRRQQNANLWETQATEADRKMQYGQGNMNWNQDFADKMRNWQNQGAYEKYTYDLARRADALAQQEGLLNQSLAIAGQGAPLTSAASSAMVAAANRDAQAKIAQQQMDAANTNAWIGAGGSVLGGLLSSNPTTGQTNAQSLYNWARG